MPTTPLAAAGRPAPARGRDARVETLRGLACVLLVAYHVRGGTPADGLQLAADDPWSRAVSAFDHLRMPLFTFLSGVVYAYRPVRQGLGRFVRGKARRLLVPMLVVGTAFALFREALFAAGAANSGAGTPWYLWHVLPVAHFWFLEAVFWIFVLVGVLDVAGRLARPAVVAALVVAAVAADVLVPFGVDPLGLRSALFLLPFFLTGLAAQRFSLTTAPLALRAGVVLVALALAAWVLLGLLGVVDPVPSRRDPVGAAVGLSACLALLLVPWRVRPLVALGAFSFTIYTTHVFGTSAARVVLERLGVESVPLHLLLGVLAGLAVGVLVELVARRWALTRTLVLGQRRRPGAGARTGAGTAAGRVPDGTRPADRPAPPRDGAGDGVSAGRPSPPRRR
ncbi:acyltransferase family protein [Kineococcus sp. SYSU DK004]|uniref:acyltransferase family protein n=1 Tax=Kineococcus sp. SYSU DK004 TaxID=3383125 RepID=UPI003D7DD7B0